MTTDGSTIATVAKALDAAWRERAPMPPITASYPDVDLAGAYAVQAAWTGMRVQRGEKIIGRKIGLTSPAIQAQLGVSEPDYGALWESSFYETEDGAVTIPAGDFLQPRVEGEVAFLIGKSLRGPHITAEDVLQATDAYALGVEIVDSRIADWKIKLIDTIADNASYGGFTLGPWDKTLVGKDLGALEMKILHNGELAAEGLSSAAFGHPAKSTAWLANKLLEFGVSLEPGDVVISGGITKMLPVTAGDDFVFSLSTQPSLKIRFS
jgi:2-keto-4-pentenoate hydratase